MYITSTVASASGASHWFSRDGTRKCAVWSVSISWWQFVQYWFWYKTHVILWTVCFLQLQQYQLIDSWVWLQVATWDIQSHLWSSNWPISSQVETIDESHSLWENNSFKESRKNLSLNVRGFYIWNKYQNVTSLLLTFGVCGLSLIFFKRHIELLSLYSDFFEN